MSADSQATTSERARRDKEAVARDFLALFKTSEVALIIEYLGDLNPHEIRQMRMTLDVAESTAKAGMLLRRLPAILGGPPLAQGGTLFLVAHAGRSAIKEAAMEKSELSEVLQAISTAMGRGSNPTWVTEDTLWTKIKEIGRASCRERL